MYKLFHSIYIYQNFTLCEVFLSIIPSVVHIQKNSIYRAGDIESSAREHLLGIRKTLGSVTPYHIKK